MKDNEPSDIPKIKQNLSNFYGVKRHIEDLSVGGFQAVITVLFLTFISKLCLTLQNETHC